jgi:hypothetical protein
LPDVFHLELVESLAPEMRDDMQPGESLIFLICLGCKVRRDDFLQPVGEEE